LGDQRSDGDGISVELVQKAAAMGTPIVVAISAPTAHATRTAEAAASRLTAVARNEGLSCSPVRGALI
jgi:formate dehydrogenase assembly factor FdhD